MTFSFFVDTRVLLGNSTTKNNTSEIRLKNLPNILFYGPTYFDVELNGRLICEPKYGTYENSESSFQRIILSQLKKHII